MIRKFITVLLLIPLTLAIALFAVANRAPVTLAFDPFGNEPPMFSAPLPLYLALLLTLIAGVIVGGIAAWAGQAKWRRRARRATAELKAARTEADALRRQVEANTAAQAQAQNSMAAIAYRHPSAA